MHTITSSTDYVQIFREAGYCGYPIGTAFSKVFGATIRAAGYDEMPETKIGGMDTSPEDYMETWQLHDHCSLTT